jgi:hypothetical protein
MISFATVAATLAASLSLVLLPGFQTPDGFTPLFDGRTLDGWEQHSGKAAYKVEDGVIVGKPVPNTGNTFLCTKKQYGDFILEFEFKVSNDMNSGVQFRSQFFEKPTELTIGEKKIRVAADRVHGYQYEIDPSKRAWTGGVYDEGRRGWLFDLKKSPDAQKAFKAGEWNLARVECRGDRIKTWLNGVPAADLTDGMTLKGVVALQVHGIGKNEKPDAEIRWRNIRIKEL